VADEIPRPDWLPYHAEDLDIVYRLDELRDRFEVRDLEGGGWLVLNVTPSSNWLRFAVLDFAGQVSGQSERASCVFYGEGPGGKDDSLRECRHTYWGENGYLFYPNGALIAAAFRELSEFYDDMVKP
jgi:hypothetical protein